MAPPSRVRDARSARYSKDTAGRTRASRTKAGQTHKALDVFDFTDTSEKEEPYEVFDPPLHSTAIYTDEEALSGPSIPSSPQAREEKRNSGASEIDARENESVTPSAAKKIKHKSVLDEPASGEEPGARSRAQPAEKISAPQEVISVTASPRLPGAPTEPPAEQAAADEEGAGRDGSAGEQEARAGGSPPQVRKKAPHSRRKKSKTKDSENSSHVRAWCLEGQRSDIMELGVVLSVFEDVCLKYKQKVESKRFKETIDQFHSSVKEELIKALKEAQKVKALKRKNAKIVSDMERKRQHLIKVQDELLCLEPQLKQLQTKYDELMERKAALSNATYFLSNLKQLQEHSDFQEKKQKSKETYDSSSLPALLYKARPLWRAETHLQNINHRLETLLDQERANN